jgi:hypothetical protein
MLDHLRLTANHHAVTPIQAAYTPAGPHIDIVDSLLSKFAGTPDIVHVIRVAAVDEDVIRLKVQ